mmetsp:Transcript_24149/g.75523  ORF Transcript_24149/g.75523 Transcript_24149/m.75523 type:complete len:1043 (-) Transcript_24149:259-3387(-)
MDDDSIANESGPVEPMVVEVEILDARGLDQDCDLNRLEDKDTHFYYEASMQLVSSLTGEPIHECGVQWVKLRHGRRMTFMTPRHAADRFVFGGVTSSSLLAVRFDVFKKLVSTSPGTKQGSACRLIGVAEVTPWIVVDEKVEDESRYCRWVRLVEDTTLLGGKRPIKGTQGLFGGRQRRAASKRPGTSSLSVAARASATPQTKRQRSELRVSVTSKVGTGDALADAIAVADNRPQWFLQPKPAVDPPNVVRIAVIRSSDVLSATAVVRARLSANIEEVDDPSLFFANENSPVASMVAVTRPSPFGVWMETLELKVPPKLAHLHRDAFYVDVAIMHRVMGSGGKSDELLLRRAVIPMANVSSDEACWIDFKPNVSLKLALRWDYNEVLDFRESRPFFDAERFELKPSGQDLVGSGRKKDKKEKKKSCNAVRVVLARGRHPPPSIATTITNYAPKHALIVPGMRFAARVSLSLGGLKGLAPAPQLSRVATVRPDLTILWNECFEFVFPQESTTGQTSIRIDLIPLDEHLADEDQPGLAVVFEAPRNEVSRAWYDVMETDADGELTETPAGAQLQALGMRFYDSTLNQEDMRAIVTEALSFAFPEVDLRSIERVYDSTKDVADACVALSSLTASTERDSDIDSAMFVASCNATDLAWAIQPIKEEKEDDECTDVIRPSAGPTAAAAASALTPINEDRGSMRDSLNENRQKHLNWERQNRMKSATALMLTKGETIKLIKQHPVGALNIGILNGGDRERAESSDGESSVSSNSELSPIEERRTLILNPDGPDAKQKRFRGRKTTVRVAATLTDTSERIRSMSIKIDVAVDRTPRDFVTLRSGLVAKLGQGEDAVPQLPKWIRKALRIKLKTQRVSIATGVGAASGAAAAALVTGVAPVLILPGAVGIGLAVCSGSAHVTESMLKREIQKDIAQSTWLASVAHALASNTTASNNRLSDAVMFFKQFMAHGAICTMHKPPRRKLESLGRAEDLEAQDEMAYGEMKQEETKEDIDEASITHGVDDFSMSSGPSTIRSKPLPQHRAVGSFV